MRMDLVKPRYETFDELYKYCYKVAGTVGLMTTPVMGVDPSYKVCLITLSVICAVCFQSLQQQVQCQAGWIDHSRDNCQVFS